MCVISFHLFFCTYFVSPDSSGRSKFFCDGAQPVRKWLLRASDWDLSFCDKSPHRRQACVLQAWSFRSRHDSSQALRYKSWERSGRKIFRKRQQSRLSEGDPASCPFHYLCPSSYVLLVIITVGIQISTTNIREHAARRVFRDPAIGKSRLVRPLIGGLCLPRPVKY
jgi:hypothetical protein